MSDLILYTSEDGRSRLQLRVDEGTIWLSQAEIAELFQTTKQNVSLHAKNILEERELGAEATVKESLTVQTEGKREVMRVKQRKDLTLDYWRQNVDQLLRFNDQAVLSGPGSISHDDMKRVVHERYETFDANRRAAEAIEADEEDLKQIEDLERKLKEKEEGKGDPE